MRPPREYLSPSSDVLSDTYEGHQSSRDDGDDSDVRARWAVSAAQAASRAYTAAYGREIADDSTRMRWRLEPRVAVTAAIVLILLGVGTWWVTSAPPGLPAAAQPAGTASPTPPPADGDEPGAENAHKDSVEPELVVVHVSGHVAQPGLITLEVGARVADAVDKAGGAVGDADLAAVNLARLARDGEQIHVPAKGEAPQPGATSGPVNLNTADEAALEALPGVGPVLAQRIVTDRDANGTFGSLEDLARVSGVGDAMVANLVDLAVT